MPGNMERGGDVLGPTRSLVLKNKLFMFHSHRADGAPVIKVVWLSIKKSLKTRANLLRKNLPACMSRMEVSRS